MLLCVRRISNSITDSIIDGSKTGRVRITNPSLKKQKRATKKGAQEIAQMRTE